MLSHKIVRPPTVPTVAPTPNGKGDVKRSSHNHDTTTTILIVLATDFTKGMWDLRVSSTFEGGDIFTTTWYGDKNAAFSIERVNSSNYNQYLKSWRCKSLVEYCQREWGTYAYYIRANNGECLKGLHCGYYNFKWVKKAIIED